MDKSWRDMPPGRERQAARAQYYAERERSKPIAPDCPVKQVTVDGKTGIRGPSRVVHFYDGEAQEQIATRLARTRAQPFPDCLTTEMSDGQLIVSCKTKPYALAIPRGLPPRFVEIAIDHLREAEQEHRAATNNPNQRNSHVRSES